jgi:hypothetical protein
LQGIISAPAGTAARLAFMSLIFRIFFAIFAVKALKASAEVRIDEQDAHA